MSISFIVFGCVVYLFIWIISGMIYRPAKFVIVTGLNMAQDNEAIKDNHTQSFGILKKYDLKKKVDTTE